MQIRVPVIVAVLFAIGGGCATRWAKDSATYETVGNEPRRDADVARGENARAVAYLERNEYEKAEVALKSALAADIMCGPAHNNLGKVYFHNGLLYKAAWEFQYALKLMPNQAEPHNNLGLVFERVGKMDEAAASYDKALTLEPENVDAMGNLARARVRRGDRDESVCALLQKLVERETRPEWLSWERTTLARLKARRAE